MSSKTIVIDAGSNTIKAGIGGNDLPTSITPSIIGEKTFVNQKKEYFVGKNCDQLEDIFVKHPIEFRQISNWDSFERLLNFVFYQELKVSPDDHPIFMSQPLFSPHASNEKMTELVFETFNSPGFFMSPSSVLALFSSGRTSGTVLDSGFQETHCIPITDGYKLPHASQRVCFGGKNTTENLMKKLKEKNLPLSIETVNDIKEKMCFVYHDQQEKVERIYSLPDGNLIKLEHELMDITNLIFHENSSFHDLIYSSIRKCEPDIERDLYSNILICGGNTMFKGLGEDIYSRMSTMVSIQTEKYMKFVPCDRMHSSWIGGSISSSLSSFQSMWITPDEYEEKGAQIIHMRCF
jgi:actin-related protein